LFLLSPYVIIGAIKYMFMLTRLHSWGYWVILYDDCSSVLWTRHSLSYLVCPHPNVDRNVAFYMPAQWDVTVKYCVW